VLRELKLELTARQIKRTYQLHSLEEQFQRQLNLTVAGSGIRVRDSGQRLAEILGCRNVYGQVEFWPVEQIEAFGAEL
jgi:hypothetical protein